MDLQRTKVLCFCDGDFYKVGTWLVEFANWRAEAFAAQARRSPGARASPRYTRRDAAIAIHLAVLAVLAHVVVNLAHFRPDNRPSECALLFCSKKNPPHLDRGRLRDASALHEGAGGTLSSLLDKFIICSCSSSPILQLFQTAVSFLRYKQAVTVF